MEPAVTMTLADDSCQFRSWDELGDAGLCGFKSRSKTGSQAWTGPRSRRNSDSRRRHFYTICEQAAGRISGSRRQWLY